MKRLGLLCASAILLTLTSARAENLFVNGDFSAASLQPWTSAGGAVLASGKASLNNGSIQQVISTKVGAEYYIVLSATTVTPSFTAVPTVSVAAGPQGGNAVDFESTVQVTAAFPGLPGASPRHVFRLTASGTITVITISGTAVIDAIAPSIPVVPMVDDLAIYELGRSKLAGKYTGSLVATTAIKDPALTQSDSSRVNARVTSEGRIYVLIGGELGTGVVQNDGTVDFVLPSSGRITGQAKLRAGRIEITLPAVQSALPDEFGVALKIENSTKLILTRTGK